MCFLKVECARACTPRAQEVKVGVRNALSGLGVIFMQFRIYIYVVLFILLLLRKNLAL